MSADLWAAFGNGEDATSNPWSQMSPVESSTQSKQTKHSSEQAQSNPLPDIHASRRTENQLSYEIQSPWGDDATFSSLQKLDTIGTPDTSVISSLEQGDNDWNVSTRHESIIDPWIASKPSGTTEVLWDADQMSDDDFGDFEDPLHEVPATKNIASKMSNLEFTYASSHSERDHNLVGNQLTTQSVLLPDLLPARGRVKLRRGLEPDHTPAMDNMTIIASAMKDKHSLVAVSESESRSSLVDQQPSATEEQWDEWSPDPVKATQFPHEDASRGTPNPKPSASTLTISEAIPQQNQAGSARPAARNSSRSSSSSRPRLPPTSTVPPTNIPPPSILISLLSTLISTLPAQVEKAMQTFTTKSESTAAADKALSTAVRKCLSALRVAARIIAGRRLRWKRDTHLSQSMRIGPAAGTGKGGMKLSGVDKMETKREDREVAEFVRIWQAKLGSVRRALANVNSKISECGDSGTSGLTGASNKRLEIPSMAETMIIRTLKDEDGGVRSAKGCTLCGVKREERVDKVDGMDLLDISSEWWIEHWGHTECRAFWYQHEKYLQQR